MEPKDNSEAVKTVEQPKSGKATGTKPADPAPEPAPDEPTQADVPASTDAESKSEKRKKADASVADTKPDEPAGRPRNNATLNNDSARKTDKAGTTQALTKPETDVPEPDDADKQAEAPKPAGDKDSAVDPNDQGAVDKRVTAIQNQIKILEEEAKLVSAKAAKAKAEQAEVTDERKAIRELLDAHKGNIPALIQQVNTELQKKMGADKSLSLDSRLEFSKADGLRVPLATEKLNLEKSSNFFDLEPKHQIELYDRIGLFRGIVVDHRHELPMEQGYRNVYPFVPGTVNAASLPVQVFYRKPRLSGYAESTYAFDEKQLKTQQSGIFSVGFGLSASFKGFGKSVAVKAGYGYANERNDETALHEQQVSVTSNFFLPKIELSLDTLRPTAHPDFVAAVKRVVLDEQTSSTRKFEQLNHVLRQFGHFVATSLTIGGRLYSTETKSIKSSSQLHNFLEKKALDIQVAARGWGAELGGEVKRNEEGSDKNHSRQASENQASQLHAVGGDGVFVNNPARWVESLQEYKAWSLVKYDDLVPSLTLLPANLQQKCHSLLSEVVADPATTIEGLLEQHAHYLFYDGYLAPYGSQVEPRYFVLKGIDTDTRVLSVATGRKANDADVHLVSYSEEPHQQWWMTPDGRLRCRGEQDDTESYVLALNNNRLVINQEGYFDNQYWELAGGMLKNLGTNQYVVIKDQETPEISDESAAKRSRNVWQVLPGSQLHKLRKPKSTKSATKMKGTEASTLPNGYYLAADQTLVSRNGNAVLRLEGSTLVIDLREQQTKRTVELFRSSDGRTISQLILENGQLEVVLEKAPDKPDREALADNSVTGGHKLELLNCGSLELVGRDGEIIWEKGDKMYSTLKRAGSDAVLTFHHVDYLPNVEDSSNHLTTLPFVGADHQLWYVNSNKQIISKLVRANGQKLALTDPGDGPLVLMPLNPRNKAQQWTMNENGTGAIQNQQTNSYLSYSQDGRLLESKIQLAADWEMRPQSLSVSNSPHRLQFHTSAYTHKEQDNDGYLHFKNRFDGYIHLADFELESAGKELRGLRICKHGNRFAIEAMLKDGAGNEYQKQSTIWDEGNLFSSFKKDAFWLDKAPVYLGSAPQRIGLRKKGGGEDSFALTASAGGRVFNNDDQNRSIRLTADGMDFVDMKAVLAPDDEYIVGFGFTKVHNNRLGLYLLTLKKTAPATGRE